MEQATTGNAPPPIAINSGGGIQILNMNAVRGPTGIGPTVVPSPGSAQTAVGSPGPPGKGGVGGGPRMISISPHQMLANAGRPGQPVDESDTESVNQCDDDDNHEPLKTTNTCGPEPRGSPSSPASITGVSSSDLQQQHACDDNDTVVDVNCEEGELHKDDSIAIDSSHIIVRAKALEDRVEGNRSIDDENDLSLSDSAVDKPVTSLGSPNQIVDESERSVPQTPSPPPQHFYPSPSSSSSSPQPPPISPPTPPSKGDDDVSCPPSHQSELDNELINCDENKNHEGGAIVGYNSYCTSSKNSPTSGEVDNLDLGKENIDENGSISSNENVIINSHNSPKETGSKGAQSPQPEDADVDKLGSEDVNDDKCIYEDNVKNDVPVQRDRVYTSRPDEENSTSDLGALQHSNNNNNVDNSTSQLCVQTICKKSVVEENCSDKIDDQEEAFLMNAPSAIESNISSGLSVLNKCLSTSNSPGIEEEPPPLVHEDTGTTEMGNNESKQRQTVVEEVVDEATVVDDVNLDMFSDSGVPDDTITLHNSNCSIIQQVERSPVVVHENRNVGIANSLQENEMRAEEREEESRPKLMDMNLVDFIYMDCEDEIEVPNEAHSSPQATAIVTPTTPSGGSNQVWNQTTTRPAAMPITTSQSTPAEHPYSPPKIINEIFTSTTTQSNRISSVVTSASVGAPNTFSQSSPYWNKSNVITPASQQRQLQPSPPSCAFQLYGHQSQQQQRQSENTNNLHIAARIPMRNDLHNSQQHGYSSSSIRQPQAPAFSNFNNTLMRDGASGLPPPPPPSNNNPVQYPSIRANINSNISSEYKANHSHSQHLLQQQQQRCFTNDPQLHSQFIQYTQNFPLGQSDGKQEPAKSSSTLPSSGAIARGQYAHAPTHHQQHQDHTHSTKTQPIKPVVIFQQQQSHQYQQHQINSVSQPTGVVQQQPHVQQQRQYTPVVSQQHYQHPQNSPFQSQFRPNTMNANGCDNPSKPGYHLSQQPSSAVNIHGQSNYMIGHGHGQPQPPTSVAPPSSIRQTMGTGGTTASYFPRSSHQNISTSIAQSQVQTRQLPSQQLQPPTPIQKETSSCSYTNLTAVRMPNNQAGVYNNPSHMNQSNFSGSTAPATAVGPQHNSYPPGNFGGYNSTASSSMPHQQSTTRMPFPPQQHAYAPAIRPTPNMPSSSSQISNSSNLAVGPPSSVAVRPQVGSGWNPPQFQGARAQLRQVLRPGAFANQNLAGRGEIIQQTPVPQTPHHQTVNRLPYPGMPPQQHYRTQHPPAQGQQGAVPVAPQHQIQQRSASVIAPRYSGGSTTVSHHGMPGGSSENQQKQPPTSSSTTMPSPQMLRNSQYIAHSFRPTTASSEHGPSSSSPAACLHQSSVIRPNVFTTSTGSVVAAGVSTNSGNTSAGNNRTLYGSSGTNNNTYYNNQASVIRAPPGSSSIVQNSASSSSNACTINRNSSNSCIVIERGGNQSNAGQHHSTSSSTGGYNGGELTLQSFLSNPAAPFMCPSSSPTSTPSTSSSPLTAERSTSGGSGYHYNNSSENWGGASYHARGDNQDETYPSLSSCQYSDGAMRRYNAPITLQSLQALSGLPPGANHLLVKTENGQFQLVSVRMQSPTAAAAAPGTPVVPSTVAAPPTSMSIAQQLPSNSPLAPPLPPPPHSAPPPGVTPPSLVPPPPISSSMITTTTIPPHPSAQQGRIITSSSSNHIVTSWSSSNNNSLVNNNSTTSSPLPVISSSAAHPPPPHPPHLAPPPPSSAPPIHAPPLPTPPLPPSVPSSVIMPPSLSSASNSQLLISTANNNISSSSTSSSTYSTAAQAAISAAIENYNQQRAASASSVQHGSVMGPPGGSRQQPPPPLPSNSIPTAGPMSNSLPPGASVIRSGGGVLGASSLPPPPPIVVSTSSSAAAAAVAAVANSVISSSTNPSNSNLPTAAPTSPATFRQQSNTASSVPNNNATNNAQSGSMGMMTASSNSIMSVQHPNHHHHHHQTPPPYNSQLHPHPQPPQQAPPSSAYHTTSYTSNSIASSNTTANTVSQMSNETAKTKCKNFLSFLLELSAKQNQTVARNVKNLIQGLIDGKVNEENFADRLQKEVNSQPQPCLVGFLKKSLPHLRHSLAVSELKIEGIKPPPLATLVPPTPVTALVQQTPPTPSEPTRKKPSKQTPTVRPTTPTVPASPVRIITPPVNSASPSSTPPTPVSASSSGTPAPPTTSPSPSSTKSSKPSKGSSSKSKSNSSSNSSSAGGSSASSGPGGTPSSKSNIPSTSKSSKEKEKKDKPFSSSGYSADDDINDVAAMGGVNLAEESQRILGSTEYVGTQIRSCRDETLIQASPISAKFKVIATKYGLDETPSAEVSALLSHAVEERLKTMVEKLSVIAEHRMDVIKLDERYEITQDVKGQLRFLEELDKLEKKRHDEQEREMLIRAAKSRSKSEDPEQAKLKAKAKEMQRVALEEMRQRDANLTALQAIGPRKKPKLDSAGGSHGSAVPSPLGATGASSSLGRPQMPLRPRLKRVNLRDLLFLLEHDKETMRSPFLYKNLLLK